MRNADKRTSAHCNIYVKRQEADVLERQPAQSFIVTSMPNMQSGRKSIMHEVFIACPVCFSGNHFQLHPSEQKLACDDCGFILAENLSINSSKSEGCIFCGNRKFYFESPLGLLFLGRDSICYVCEARYKTACVNDPDEKYDERMSERSQSSESAMQWKERIMQYDQQSAG